MAFAKMYTVPAGRRTEESQASARQLAIRLRTGVILVTSIGGLVLLGKFSFLLLVLLINILTLSEFYGLFRKQGTIPRSLWGILLSVIILLGALFKVSGIYLNLVFICVPVFFGVLAAELFLRSDRPFENLALTFFGVLYITVPLCMFFLSAFLTQAHGRYDGLFVLGYFVLLWTSDSLAYLAGRRWGRHKLFVRISPGKTWEGLVAGAAGAATAGLLLSTFITRLDAVNWIVVALAVSGFGTLGDLVKSLLKRSLNIKDSGTLLPGHGGMLDRFDTLLGSAPFVYCYLMLLSHG